MLGYGCVGYDDMPAKSVEFAKRAHKTRGDRVLKNAEHLDPKPEDRDKLAAESMEETSTLPEKEGEPIRFDTPNDPKMATNQPEPKGTAGIRQPGGSA